MKVLGIANVSRRLKWKKIYCNDILRKVLVHV